MAILKALSYADKSYHTTIHIVTDCLSLLTKIDQWKSWDTSLEYEIAAKISTITKSKALFLHFAKAHSGVGLNCAVDEIITVAWHKVKNRITNAPIVPKTHQEVKEAINKKLMVDQEATQTILQEEHNSISSKNILNLRLGQTKMANWIQKYKYDRTTQSTMLSMITDTSFRINGDRLICPHCPNTELSLEHVLSDCHIYHNERRDAYFYTDKKDKKEVLISTDLFPNFCCAAKDKIYNTITLARQAYNSEHSTSSYT